MEELVALGVLAVIALVVVLVVPGAPVPYGSLQGEDLDRLGHAYGVHRERARFIGRRRLPWLESDSALRRRIHSSLRSRSF